jgi:hypothetical protein
MGTDGKKAKGLQDKLDDIMSAVTFAEAGEHETAREMIGAGPSVLLAAKAREENGNAFTYALNVTKRIGARLDILYVSSMKSLEPALVKFMSSLNQESIPWRFIQRPGCLKNQIIDYAEQNPEVMFVVTESSDNLDAECRRSSNKLNEAWENLKCPLVVVSPAERA